jgi:hypothetical protein
VRPGLRLSRSAGRPALAAATAVACLAAQALGFAHLALVSHTTCPEHNTLVHGQPAAAATRAPRKAAAAPAPALRVAPAADDAGDAHEHCLVASLRRRESAPLSAAAARVPAPAAAPPCDDRAQKARPPHSVPLLHLAPKGSPPAAALA